jgi:hypothetical protein
MLQVNLEMFQFVTDDGLKTVAEFLLKDYPEAWVF